MPRGGTFVIEARFFLAGRATDGRLRRTAWPVMAVGVLVWSCGQGALAGCGEYVHRSGHAVGGRLLSDPHGMNDSQTPPGWPMRSCSGPECRGQVPTLPVSQPNGEPVDGRELFSLGDDWLWPTIEGRHLTVSSDGPRPRGNWPRVDHPPRAAHLC